MRDMESLREEVEKLNYRLEKWGNKSELTMTEAACMTVEILRNLLESRALDIQERIASLEAERDKSA